MAYCTSLPQDKVSESPISDSFISLTSCFTLEGSSGQKLDGKYLDEGAMFQKFLKKSSLFIKKFCGCIQSFSLDLCQNTNYVVKITK